MGLVSPTFTNRRRFRTRQSVSCFPDKNRLARLALPVIHPVPPEFFLPPPCIPLLRITSTASQRSVQMACASYARATSFQRSSEDSSKVKTVDFSYSFGYSFYATKETRVEILAREWKRKECKGLFSLFVSIPIEKIQRRSLYL